MILVIWELLSSRNAAEISLNIVWMSISEHCGAAEISAKDASL